MFVARWITTIQCILYTRRNNNLIDNNAIIFRFIITAYRCVCGVSRRSSYTVVTQFVITCRTFEKRIFYYSHRLWGYTYLRLFLIIIIMRLWYKIYNTIYILMGHFFPRIPTNVLRIYVFRTCVSLCILNIITHLAAGTLCFRVKTHIMGRRHRVSTSFAKTNPLKMRGIYIANILLLL